MLVSVAVPVPSLDLLTYRVPDGVSEPRPGARVLVPLGARRLTGVVVETGVAAPAGADGAGVTLKHLLDILDDEPLLPASIVELGAWVADYYACGAGEALSAAMPPFAWVESELRVRLTEAGRGRAGAATLRPSTQRESLLALTEEAWTPLRSIAYRLEHAAGRKRGRTVPARALARTLAAEGYLEIDDVLRGSVDRFKTTKVAELTVAGREVLEALADPAAALGAVPVGSRQRETLRALAGPAGGIDVADLREQGISADVVQRLAARGWVSIRQERVDRDPFARGAALRHEGLEPRVPVTPTPEQKAALEQLLALAADRRFACALLHGVTGSGKTEVYLRLAAAVREAGRTVLVLVPEIGLTPALAAVFRGAFGDRVAIQHSGLSDGERHDQWHRIRRGDVDVVVGTRSAVFAPLASLGLIVVDEEHDGSYKQEESPRYHGRDVAVMRGKREGALVVLGSATPSLESYHNATSGRYALVTLARRVLDRPLACVSIVNMRDEYADVGPDIVLSRALQQGVEARLARGEQVLLLLNRRGLATAIFCRQCGNTIECPNCSVSLTVHTGRHARRGRCHYCNYAATVPAACPQCAAPYLEQAGFGTERVEQEVVTTFPSARVARLDRDTIRKRGAVGELLARFAAREIDVLVGTQMIAKGHDFPRVTLVGVISADIGLGLADFRAAERTFQLLTQVVGRAGRGDEPGEAVIQTLFPEHYGIRHACRQDYGAFFEEELAFRRAMRYPPIVALTNGIVRAPTLAAAMGDAGTLVQALRERAREGEFVVLGPAPAPFVKLRGEHRAQFFLKGARRPAMRDALRAVLAAQPEMRRRVAIDVDAVTVL